MFMNTQILSHYSANKSSDVGALCGRAGHLIKTALKKKEQIVISSWGSLRVSCKAHMVIWKSMCHFGDSSGSLGGQLAGLAGMDQVTPGVEVQCEGSRVTLPSLDTQHWAAAVWVTHSPQPGGKQWHCRFKKSWPPPPNVSDSSCPLYTHATPVCIPGTAMHVALNKGVLLAAKLGLLAPLYILLPMNDLETIM